MKVGDLVSIKETDTDPQGRFSGIVLRFDVHHPDSSNTMIRIVEVLWPEGKGWVARERLSVIGCELEDSDLEHVIGGMSPGMFSLWRSNMLNSS